MFEKFVSEDSNKSNEELTKMLGREDQNQMPQEKDLTNIDNLKEVIYKTYSKTIDKSDSLKKKEKKKMKKIMDLLIYLQMRKIELKLNYFNDFEKLIQFETQQIKSVESQIIQDRIRLAIKKSEIMSLSNKIKENLKIQTDLHEKQIDNSITSRLSPNIISNTDMLEKAKEIKVENEIKILDLN
jgi:hypothetical protein